VDRARRIYLPQQGNKLKLPCPLNIDILSENVQPLLCLILHQKQVTGQRPAPAALPLGNNHVTQRVGGWVSHRAALWRCAEVQSSCSQGGSNPEPSRP